MACIVGNIEAVNTPMVEAVTVNFSALTWERLQVACSMCPIYKLLWDTVRQGFPDEATSLDTHIKLYHRHRHSLCIIRSLVLLGEQPVIPSGLCLQVLEHIHAGHARASMMCERFSNSVFWPNYRSEIYNDRAKCDSCQRVAPSNPPLPPTQPEMPLYPFQSIAADFFSINQRNYLAVVDKYSHWLSIL